VVSSRPRLSDAALKIAKTNALLGVSRKIGDKKGV
jgi:hypothetical protein